MFFMMIFIGLSAHASSAPSFKELVNNDYVALHDAPPAERDQFLKWAQEFVDYRQRPETKAAGDFRELCKEKPETSVFCPLLQPHPAATTPATPRELRQKYFNALLRLDNDRVQACALSQPELQSIVDDPQGVRLEARALYWLWVCAVNPADRELIKERLWKRFPLDHHTFLVLEAENDPRIHQLLNLDNDFEVSFRSQMKPDFNPWLAGVEALLILKQYGSASYVMNLIGADLRKVEPEVRLYAAALMARVSRAIPSALPYSRVMVPLLALRPAYLNQTTARLLFPLDYRLDDQNARDLIEHYATDIAPSDFAGFIYYESGFNPTAKSLAADGTTACGLAQLLPSTASDVLRRPVSCKELQNPSLNLQLSSQLLTKLKNNFATWPLALAAYNGGPRRVGNWLRAHEVKDPQLRMDLMLMNENVEFHISDYVSSVLGKGNWYSALYNQ